MNQRLFIAIKIPGIIAGKIINGLILPRGFKLAEPENLHVTILFLGDTDETLVPKISDAIKSAISGIKKFMLEISEFGQFPPKGEPKILYATGRRGLEDLMRLSSAIRKNLEMLGFRDDKEFKYHATLARLKSRLRESFSLPKFNRAFEYNVDEVILFKSELKPAGPVYEKVGIFSLG